MTLIQKLYYILLKVILLFALIYFISNNGYSIKLISESSGFLKNISSFKTSDMSEYKIFTIKGLI